MEIENFKEIIKGKILKLENSNKSKDLVNSLYISLFVLSVAELEYRIKQCLAWREGPQKRDDLLKEMENYTLGRMIKELSEKRKELKEKLIKINYFGHIKIKEIITNDEFFHCFRYFLERINTTRNNLYHNLFKKDENKNLHEMVQSEKINLEKVLTQIKDFLYMKPFRYFEGDFNEMLNKLSDEDFHTFKIDFAIKIFKNWLIALIQNK